MNDVKVIIQDGDRWDLEPQCRVTSSTPMRDGIRGCAVFLLLGGDWKRPRGQGNKTQGHDAVVDLGIG